MLRNGAKGTKCVNMSHWCASAGRRENMGNSSGPWGGV